MCSKNGDIISNVDNIKRNAVGGGGASIIITLKVEGKFRPRADLESLEGE
jgi:hypothetical protein